MAGDLGAAVRMIIKGIRVKRQMSLGWPLLLAAAGHMALVPPLSLSLTARLSVHYWD